MRNVPLLLCPCILLCSAALCLAANPKAKGSAQPSNPSPDTNPSNGAVEPYLGVRIEPMHRALVSHLLHLLGEGPGILVTEVANGSPAEKAGLKQDDILVRYDGERIYRPEQLIRSVHGDKPGREITLDIIHAGKPAEIKVTLGEQHVASDGRVRRTFRPAISSREEQDPSTDQQEAEWLSFDAMTLTRDNKGNFKAQIKYRDDQGTIETRNFEGSREELRKDINAQKDVPADERDHLLRALDLSGHPFALDSPQGER